MSSMRNAAPRRPHRERAQPAGRSKWGLLEKHKDYSLRAADYNKKKAKLNILSQKTREKNPDEFAFGMLSSDKQKAGKHGRGDGDKNRLGVDEVKLLKGQDAGYLRTILGRTRREVSRVEEEIAIDGVMKNRNKVVNEKKITYDENGEPIQKRRKLDIETDDDDDEEDEDALLDNIDEDRSHPQPNSSNSDIIPPLTNHQDENIPPQQPNNDNSEPEPEPEHPKSNSKPSSQSQLTQQNLTKLKHHRQRIRAARTSKLLALKQRQKSIMKAATELELQRARMVGRIGGVNKSGVGFRVRERKR